MSVTIMPALSQEMMEMHTFQLPEFIVKPKSLMGKVMISPFLGVYCAFVASTISPFTYLTAALITEVNPLMILMVRSVQHIVVFCVIVSKGTKTRNIFVKKEILYVMGRAVSQSVSLATYYYAQTKLPTADVYAISSSSPLFATLGGYLFLKEKFGVAQGVGAVAVVIGAVFISKPSWLFGDVVDSSAEDVLSGTTLSLISCLFLAFQILFSRKLQVTETSAVVLIDGFFCASGTLACLYFYDDFRYPDCGWAVGLCLVGGVTAMITNALTVHAGKLIKAGQLSVIRSSSIFFTYIFQIWVLGLVPTWHSVVGASLILLSLVATTIKCNRKQTKRNIPSRL